MVYGSHPFKFIYLFFKENPYLIQFLNYSYRNQLILRNSYLYKVKLHLILKKKKKKKKVKLHLQQQNELVF